MKRDVELEWSGRFYHIPASRGFELADCIEQIVTIGDLHKLSLNPRFTTIAKVYGAMLRFAGADASDEAVHSDIMSQIKGGEGAKRLVAVRALSAMMMILMDGAPEPKGDSDAGNEGAAAASFENATPSPSGT